MKAKTTTLLRSIASRKRLALAVFSMLSLLIASTGFADGPITRIKPTGDPGFSTINGALDDGRLVLTATDTVWTSDGTDAGTTGLDLGAVASSPTFGAVQGISGNCALLTLTMPATGNEPWWTDFTPEGTTLLKDFRSGTKSSSTNGIGTASNGKYIFGSHSNTIYITDGTPDGTTAFAGAPSGNSVIGRKVGDTLLLNYIANWGNTYATDGVSVEDIGVQMNLTTGNHTMVGDILYGVDLNNASLIRTDGTVAGTTNLGSGPFSLINSPASFGDKVLFSGLTPTGRELGVVDAEGNFTQLTNFATGQSYPLPFVRDIPIASVSDTAAVFFVDTDGVNKMWVTDGTSEGTTALTDLSSALGNLTAVKSTLQFGDKLYFGASKTSGAELWSTDGTLGGTELLFAEAGGSIKNLTLVGNSLYFLSSNHLYSMELSSVPEPGTFVLLSFMALALLGIRFRGYVQK